MKKTSIYPDRSQELLERFEKAGNPSKLMCVPIGYAKKDHLVMFCNGNGEILGKPFSNKSSVDGVKYLIDQVSRSCRHRHIQSYHVFLGGGDVNSYAENFAYTIRAKGWLVANVNAYDAKKQRENLQVSTDRIDLMGIATMLLNRRANCCPAQTGVYRNLRFLVLHPKKLVKMKTEVRDRMHTIYAGIVPKVKQTGGKPGPSKTGCASKRSNHILKDFVVQSAFHIGRHGPKYLQDDCNRREAAGQHADFGIARRFVRIAMCMMRTSQVYLQPEMRSPHIRPIQRADYYLAMQPYLRDKWSKPNALKIAFTKDNPLGQWRYIVQEIYGIKFEM